MSRPGLIVESRRDQSPYTGNSGVVIRHLRLWRQAFAQAVVRDLQFRAQALTTMLTSLLDLGLSLIPVLVLVGFGGARGGWSGPLAVAVVGAYGIGVGLIDCFVAPNLQRMDAYIREGELDLVLIRPVSAPLYTALRWIRPAELSGVATGLTLLVVGLVVSGVGVSFWGILAGLAWLLVGVLAFSLFWTNLSYLAFWMSGSQPVADVAVMLREAGQYPLSYFPRAARIVFATVIPAGLIGTVPVQALTGSATAWWLPVAIAGVVLAGALTFAHWQIALRRYASASS
jgi:viologen exporter family transport system permease protein